ncbi:MAG: hypothetical protein KJZ80_10325 [Hyphomicrobiaceae bacterium]|nr:hypothetical protein [Hyphomicrobiaceae bacterium]
MSSWYDLKGSLLRVDAVDAALETPLLPYLEELRTAPRDVAPGFTIIIERGSPRAEPAGVRLVHEGPLPEGPVCRLSVGTGRRWLVIPRRLSLESSAADRAARMQVAPGDEALIGGSAGILAIDAALLATGQSLVHAASLRLPRREAALVLFAPSGAGKTTTALALALQGFGLMTDDATVLASTGEDPALTRVWGLPRPPKVHRRTAELLPGIGRLLGPVWNAEGEQPMPREVLRSAVDVMAGRPVPLAGLALLGARRSGAHIFRPLPKSELLVRMASDNVFRSPYGVLDDDLARYRRIARMVASTPAYELNVGSDLATLGKTLAVALGEGGQPNLSA